MSKARLNLDALSVESFETSESAYAPSMPFPMVTVTHCIYCGVSDYSCVTICADAGSVA